MDLIEQYASYLQKEKRSSGHTVQAYVNDLEAFIHFSELEATSIDCLKEVSYQLVRSWVVSLVATGISNQTINRKLSSLRSFFKWAKQSDASIQNPMPRIKGLKVGKRIPEFVKQTEIESKNQKSTIGEIKLSMMDALIIELFYQTGIRLSELIELRASDVAKDSIRVLGKRNKERVIPISADLVEAIESWKAIKDEEHPNNPYLFCTQKGVKLYPKYVYRLVNKYLSTITKLKKKSPHVLRHTFATHMLNNGAGLEVIKDLLGHANLSATQVYTHNSFSELTNIYKKAHPRG